MVEKNDTTPQVDGYAYNVIERYATQLNINIDFTNLTKQERMKVVMAMHESGVDTFTCVEVAIGKRIDCGSKEGEKYGTLIMIFELSGRRDPYYFFNGFAS